MKQLIVVSLTLVVLFCTTGKAVNAGCPEVCVPAIHEHDITTEEIWCCKDDNSVEEGNCYLDPDHECFGKLLVWREDALCTPFGWKEEGGIDCVEIAASVYVYDLVGCNYEQGTCAYGIPYLDTRDSTHCVSCD